MSAENILQDKFVRPIEVADQLGVSRSTIYRWFWEGRLKGIKFSERNIRISLNSVKELLETSW